MNTVLDLLEALKDIPFDAELRILNQDAKEMSKVKQKIKGIRIEKFERLPIECHGMKKGDKNLKWERVVQVILIGE